MLFIEGIGWLFGVTKLFSPVHSSLFLFSTIDHGLLNLLAAALIVTDAAAIHQHSLKFSIARALKFWYPLCSSSFSVALIVSRVGGGLRRTWLVVRLIITLIWLSEYMEELKAWKIKALKTPPIKDIEWTEYSDEESNASSEYTTGSLFHGVSSDIVRERQQEQLRYDDADFIDDD
jgi:hypothetical protein